MEIKEFKENILKLFDKYKDIAITPFEKFNNEILLKYGFVPSTNLKAKIINYQIQRYGSSLQGRRYIEAYNKSIKLSHQNLENKKIRENAKYKLFTLETEKEQKIKRALEV